MSILSGHQIKYKKQNKEKGGKEEDNPTSENL
jgi:hypothetical protein